MLKKLSPWLALVMAAFALQVPAAAPVTAADWQPAFGATFNVPRPWGSFAQRNRIITEVEESIRHAQPGSTVLIATYLFDKRSSVDALLTACENGASVRVILDGNINNNQSKRLIEALNGDNKNPDGSYQHPKGNNCRGEANVPPLDQEPMSDAEVLESVEDVDAVRPSWGGDQSYVTKCDKSCRGSGASMHGKFYAFSQTGTASNVVMVSSSNLNAGGASKGWNDMYTFQASPEHFRMYRKVHLEMTDEDRVGAGEGPSYTAGNGPFLSRFFPWTGAGKAADPVLKDLNKVRCTGSPLGRTTVHVSQFWIKGTRGNYIVDKLLALARNGCRVSIIYGAPSIQIATRLRAAAKKRLITLYDSRWNLDKDPEVEVRTHAKYVLVKGRYGDDASAHEVMTGTANWNPGSLARGDENSLNVSSASAWHDYVANWNAIRKHSRKLPYNG